MNSTECPVEYLNLWWDGHQWVVVSAPDDVHRLNVAQIVAGLGQRRLFDFDLLSPEQLSAYNEVTR
jgi:hypothetical protein